MADDIVQIIENARVDATSLSEFIYYPATVTVNRRLAPPIHTLNYYLQYLEGLEKVYSQPTGTVEVNGEVVKTVRQSINDAIDSAILGDYQTTLESELVQEVVRAINRENDIEGALDAEIIRATDAEGSISQDLSDLSLEVEAQKLDTGIIATAKFGGVARIQSDVNAETVSTEDFGASTSNVDNTTQINNAIAYCKTSGATLVLPYEYSVTGNLVGLHDVNTTGTGSITRNGKKWHITPHGSETNYYYVAPNGLASNDGLSPEQPLTIAKVNSIVRYNVGAKSGDGIWGMQMANGTYTDEGVRLLEWPVFKNLFRWYGETTTANADIEPLTIWQTKPTNTEPYAVLAQDISAYLNIDFKYIHFKDWSGNGATASAGAIVVWNDGRYNVEACWFTNTPFGFTHRRSVARVKRCRFVNSNTAFAAGYQATSYVGDLSTGGNKFIDCGTGAATGRGSIMYAQKNTFDGCGNDFECTRLSRMRPQGNIHRNWTGLVYFLQAGGVLTPDNGGGYPDVFETPVTRATPIYFGGSGSFHTNGQSGTTVGGNSFSNTQNLLPPTVTTEVLLSDYFSDAGYVPFRIPQWLIYSPTFKLTLELDIIFDTNAGCILRLSGQGSAAAAELCSITVPNQAGYKFAKVVIAVVPYGTNQVSTIYRCAELGIASRKISTINSALAGQSDAEILYRLYAKSTGTGNVSFTNLRSYVEM